ncbi:MAG: FkbM family methyltransferase [Campylobacterales bacterium]|nr:FkbM family methyltransferase [Campylobacterales bacterium]
MLNIDKKFNEVVEVLFDTQNNQFDNIYEKEKIERFKNLCKTKKLVVFGTGYYLKSIVKYFKINFGVDVYGAYDWVEEVKTKDGKFANIIDYQYLDLEKYYKYIEKVKLISKEEFYENPNDIVIFINTDSYAYLTHTLYRNGFKHIYCMRNLAKNLLSLSLIEKRQNGFDEYDLNKLNHKFTSSEIANIISLYNLLEDKKSKEVFTAILKFKLTEDYFYPISVKDNTSLQYFDKEVLTLSDDEVFIDCGAYTGDTIASFLKSTNGKFKHIYSYEPEQNSFEILKDYVDVLEQKDKITIINAGVYYKNKTFYLHGEGWGVSCTNEVTNRKTKVVSIDETIEHIPTFIKMDIQTFEIQALLGGINNIIKYKPKLAISIYHKFDDLWNIPLLLKQWIPEYKLIMRHYECTQEETIIYAIPK